MIKSRNIILPMKESELAEVINITNTNRKADVKSNARGRVDLTNSSRLIPLGETARRLAWKKRDRAAQAMIRGDEESAYELVRKDKKILSKAFEVLDHEKSGRIS